MATELMSESAVAQDPARTSEATRTGRPLRLVLLCHPPFRHSNSMPRFARLLSEACRARGHEVEVWTPRARAHRLWPWRRGAKWAGYVDEYLIFPLQVRRARRRMPPDTIYVFCDQALGPWVPLLADRPHVVHVHDLLALRSALGDTPEHPTGLTGRLYQRYIRWGFRHARHFISVSRQTREELHRFGRVEPLTSEVVYHGLNYAFGPLPPEAVRERLRAAGLEIPSQGFLLHVGGGQWYKNLRGIVLLYAAYARSTPSPPPLWCVSPQPNALVREALSEVMLPGRVQFLGPVAAATLHALYAGAQAMLFPSLAEGFGWPIIEAQACGCPVLTTDSPPMSEIAGPVACRVPRLEPGLNPREWAHAGARVLEALLSESPDERQQRRERARRWAARFDSDRAVETYLAVYRRALAAHRSATVGAPMLGESAPP